ncbi:MAG TPA: MFS transporter [Bryobacteraceae bacterium]|nr:MFS transporter [Bryobacteraceae bacterium]
MKRLAVRHRIVLLALLINAVCYTDRVCIAILGPEISKTFQFNQAQMGLVYSIFSLSYFLGQTPWGIAADRYGSRLIVSLAVFFWSVFTGLTALVSNFVSLLFVRFTFGALEAALSPSVASAFNRWVPMNERATAFGAFLGGGRFGGAITPPIAGFLLFHYGWRVPFLVFGATGLLWSVLWYRWYRDTPEEHPKITQAELNRLKDQTTIVRGAASRTNWKQLLQSQRLWCLLGVAFGATFLWQFYATWFPTYLRERRGMSMAESSMYASLPFLTGLCANWIGGLLTDWIGRRKDDRYARSVVGFVSLLAAAALMSSGIWCETASTAALLMGLAAGAIDLYLGAAWSSATDIGGASGGAVAGLMNAASNCAAFASPALMGWVLLKSNNWDYVLLLSVGTTLIAMFLWLFVNPRRQAPASLSAAVGVVES